MLTSQVASHDKTLESLGLRALSSYKTAPSVKRSGNNGSGRCQQSLASAGARRHTITIATIIIIIVWAITSLTKLNRQGRRTVGEQVGRHAKEILTAAVCQENGAAVIAIERA